MPGIDPRVRAAMGRVFPAAETVAVPQQIEVEQGVGEGIDLAARSVRRALPNRCRARRFFGRATSCASSSGS